MTTLPSHFVEASPRRPLDYWDLPDEFVPGGAAWRPWAPEDDELPGRLGAVARAAGVVAIVVLGLAMRLGIELAAANLSSLDAEAALAPAAAAHTACVQMVDGTRRTDSTGGSGGTGGAGGLASTVATALLRSL